MSRSNGFNVPESHGGAMRRSLIAKLASVVLAAVASVMLTFLTPEPLERYGVPNPGIYVWGLLHPHPRPGFLGPDLGSLLGTEIVVDGACWFIVLMVAAFLIDRAVKRSQGSSPR